MKTVKMFEFPPPLTQSQKTVLKSLAKEGPTNAYQIAKKTEKSYSLIFNAVKDLEKRDIVKLEGQERTEKGTTANIYDLTLIGVLFVLGEKLSEGIKTWNQKHVSRMIRKYKSLLPLVFGKWGHLNRMGIGEMALFRVKGIVDTYRGDPNSFRKGVGHYPWLEIEEQITRFFYFFGFYPRTWTGWKGVEDPKAWMTMWKQDEDIRTYVIDGIQEELEKFRKATIRGRNILSFLQKD